MRYLCLIYFDEKKAESIPKEQLDAIAAECWSHVNDLRERGQLIAAERLEPVRTAATVRVSDGKVSITDGPFAETKEQLGGFYLIEARDLNDAIRVASHIPPGRLGSIEVRPVSEPDQHP